MSTRFSVSTSSLEMPLRQAIRTAAEMKVSSIRCDVRTELKPRELSQTGRREFLYLLKEFDLQLSALNFTVRRPFYEQDDLDARVQAAREALELAGLLKVRHLCLRIGDIPEEDSPNYGILQQAIEDLARHGNHVGVVLTVIPVGRTLDGLKQFLSTIRSGPVAVDFDPSRFLLGGQDPIEALRNLHQYVEQFTARDATRDFAGGGEEVPLGRGEVVWDETIATLSEIGYRGPINVQRTTGSNRLRDLTNAIAYLTRVSGEIW